MKTRRIGSLEVSVIGLGCNQFGQKIDADDSKRVIDAAIDAGITFLDTSDRYGYGPYPYSGFGRSEEFIGAALRGPQRDRVTLATKFGNPIDDNPENRGGKPAYVKVAVDRSLARLQTDRIDLYQIHRPDPSTPVGDTLGALNELIEAGKVREIGCSNFTIEQLAEATEFARANGIRGFASVQNEYSMLCREPEAEVLPFSEREGIAFLPYFPLASGLLTGKYVKGRPAPADSRLATAKPNRPHLGLDEHNLEMADRLGRFAAKRGKSLVELAFAWLLARPAVASVIAGSTKPDQVRTNVETAGWQLTPEDLAEIDALYEGVGTTR